MTAHTPHEPASRARKEAVTTPTNHMSIQIRHSTVKEYLTVAPTMSDPESHLHDVKF
jgi:hypothetical protein